MNNSTNIKVAKKYENMINNLYTEGHGSEKQYVCELIDGYEFDHMECGILFESSQSEILHAIRHNIVKCEETYSDGIPVDSDTCTTEPLHELAIELHERVNSMCSITIPSHTSELNKNNLSDSRKDAIKFVQTRQHITKKLREVCLDSHAQSILDIYKSKETIIASLKEKLFECIGIMQLENHKEFSYADYYYPITLTENGCIDFDIYPVSSIVKNSMELFRLQKDKHTVIGFIKHSITDDKYFMCGFALGEIHNNIKDLLKGFE